MQPRARSPWRRTIVAGFLLALIAAQPVLAESDETATRTYAALPPRVMVPGGSSGFRLPFEPGLDVRVSQGWMTKGSHKGATSRYAYDFALPMNTPVLAAAPGVVAFTRTGNTICGGKKKTRFANVVTIYHADGSATQYGHLSTVGVEVGQVVEAGQEVGRSGKTGNTSCEPHLHFARQYQGDLVTRSVPVYFKGYERERLYAGRVVSGEAACAGPLADRKEADGLTGAFCGSWFAGEFAGPSLFSRKVEHIDVEPRKGGKRGPGGYWLDAPQPYSTRWEGTFQFAPWWYTFRIEAAGAVRVKLDGVVILEDWEDLDRARVIEVPLRMRGGLQHLEVEHFTAIGADTVKLGWRAFLIEG